MPADAAATTPSRWAALAPSLGIAALALGYLALGRTYKVAMVVPVLALALAFGIRALRRQTTPWPTTPGHWLPAIVPLAFAFVIDLQPRIVEVVLPDPDRRWKLAFTAFVLGLLAFCLLVVGVDVRRLVERAVRAVTGALAWAVSMVLFFLLLVPLGVARLWRREDPLGTGRGDEPSSAWHRAVPATPKLATRSYRSERRLDDAGGRHPVAFVARAIGVVVLLLAADFTVGWLWARVSPPPGGPQGTQVASPIRVTAGADYGEVVEPVRLDAPDATVYPPDPRAALPAMAKYPWRDEYFQELQRAPSTYWPYLLWRPLPATGRYLNIGDQGERRSYLPDVEDLDALPTVDFYGGSTTYGEGQRDQHTIASEVTRLAEAEGIPIRPVNRGVRGWVNWQELLLFEQVSADEANRPDLAVFYDGANELAAQGFSIRGVPSHTVLDQVAAQMAGNNSLVSADSPVETEETAYGHLQLLARDYRETSALVRAGRWLRETATGTPAGAAAASEATPTAGASPRQDPEQLADIASIYGRGVQLIEAVAERDGVEVVFFWQPLQGGGWTGYADDLPAESIDISRALADHDDVFIDGTHHNEEGSAIVAAAIWEHLEPVVREWYESQGGGS